MAKTCLICKKTFYNTNFASSLLNICRQCQSKDPSQYRSLLNEAQSAEDYKIQRQMEYDNHQETIRDFNDQWNSDSSAEDMYWNID